jgi:hypothetical protein
MRYTSFSTVGAPGEGGTRNPMTNPMYVRVTRLVDGMVNGQPAAAFHRYPPHMCISAANRNAGECWEFETRTGPTEIGGNGTCKAECCSAEAMIKYLDQPSQLRAPHIWGGYEGEPGKAARPGGSPLDDQKYQDYCQSMDSDALSVEERKNSSEKELSRLVIAHRDYTTGKPVDLAKGSTANRVREHFFVEIRTGQSNNVWVKVGMGQTAGEDSEEFTVLRKIPFADWVPGNYEEENIVCPVTTVIRHWFARLDDIGQPNLRLGSFKWVDESDIDDRTADPMIADTDPIWGILSVKDDVTTVRHIDTMPKFDVSSDYNIMHAYSESTCHNVAFVCAIKSGFPSPLSTALKAAFDTETGQAFKTADAAVKDFYAGAPDSEGDIDESERDAVLQAAQEAATAMLDAGGARDDPNLAMFAANFSISLPAPLCASLFSRLARPRTRHTFC